MFLQVSLVREALSAGVTLVRLLPCVGLLMELQRVSLVETTPTERAAVRLYSRVDELVSGQVAWVVETLSTCVTAEGLLPGVNGCLVCPCAGLRCEFLSAYIAVKHLLSSVCFLMYPQGNGT